MKKKTKNEIMNWCDPSILHTSVCICPYCEACFTDSDYIDDEYLSILNTDNNCIGVECPSCRGKIIVERTKVNNCRPIEGWDKFIPSTVKESNSTIVSYDTVYSDVLPGDNNGKITILGEIMINWNKECFDKLDDLTLELLMNLISNPNKIKKEILRKLKDYKQRI